MRRDRVVLVVGPLTLLDPRSDLARSRDPVRAGVVARQEAALGKGCSVMMFFIGAIIAIIGAAGSGQSGCDHDWHDHHPIINGHWLLK